MVMHHVALLDDHPAVLAGLRRLIGAEPDLEVVAAGSSAHDVARQLGGTTADVLIADYDLGRSDGLAYCLRVKRRDEAPAIIIYSAYGGPALILAARAAGADSIVDKSEPVGGLLTAIRAVAAGKRMLPAVPRRAFEAAVSKLEDEDLAVFADAAGRDVSTGDCASAAHGRGGDQPASTADRRAPPASARDGARRRCRERRRCVLATKVVSSWTSPPVWPTGCSSTCGRLRDGDLARPNRDD
jgi:DNA-binding NarL/FixJ family response regulator